MQAYKRDHRIIALYMSYDYSVNTEIFTYVVLLSIHSKVTLINIQSFIYMLYKYGIRGKSLKWFEDYLPTRTYM